ncbi:hypothetical protein Taro_053651 [Colocasia esculenta]|uniref:Uncharacterized protein n=1 Tax=Colocasia esculenta TaxID=4460 RepID=A0A843XNV0_COLES|nr:hypothetical protein [Colocasia esculenta]
MGGSIPGASVQESGFLEQTDGYQRHLPLPLGLGLPTPPCLEEGDFGATGPLAHSSALGAVVWQPYLGEVDEGQPLLEPARPYFGRTVWIHTLNLVLPLHHYLTQRSLGLCQSVVEFPSRDRTPRPGRRFRGLHDTTDWY